MNTLKATNLTKAYDSRPIVDQVSLHIDAGEIVGLLGPNGAGKTSCFYMILGLIQPDSGSIFLNGTNITAFPVHTRARCGMGYLPQEASIFRKLTVADNILAILETRSDLDHLARQSTLERLLLDFRISHIRHTNGISLSGGERRRVEIARALAASPKFILLDEPFAGIDPISIVDIKQIMMDLVRQGIGILVTDHNARDILGVCHRAYIMNNGRMIAQGAPQTILMDTAVRQVYLGEEFNL